jgi:hypothetical protein
VVDDPVELPPLPAVDGIAYQFYNLPPADAVALTGVDGADAVRQVKGMVTYQAVRRPPAELTPGVSTQHLDNLCGRADDVEEMFATLREAIAPLVFHFRTTGGEQLAVPATALPSAAALAPRPTRRGDA